MKRISGTIRNYDAGASTGPLFGNLTLNFLLVTEEVIELPFGHSTNYVPVYIECFSRPASLEGLKAEVTGSFDGFEGKVRAKRIHLMESKSFISAARDIGVGWALATVASIVVFSIVLAGLGAVLLRASAFGGPFVFFAASILFAVFFAAYGVFAFLFGIRLALPALNRAVERWIRDRITEL